MVDRFAMRIYHCQKILLLFFLLAVFLYSPAAALDSEESEVTNGGSRALEPGDFEELKKTDPDAYKQIKEEIELSEKIADIVDSFKEGKINKDAARKRLRPLVKKSLRYRLGYIDDEIKQTMQRLRYLKRIKKEPSILVEDEIEFYLK
jgi:polyhydroxyalkanoate synthesis regulator phasin